MTADVQPAAAIALLPLALIWFGLGNGSLVFRADPFGAVAGGAHTHSGFKSRVEPLRMVRRPITA